MAHFIAEVSGSQDNSVTWAVLDENGHEHWEDEMPEGLEFKTLSEGGTVQAGEIFLSIPVDYPAETITVRAKYANARVTDDPRNYGDATITLVDLDLSSLPEKIEITNDLKGFFRGSLVLFESEVKWENDKKPEVNHPDIDLEAVVWHIVEGETDKTFIGARNGLLAVDQFQRVGATITIRATLIHFGLRSSFTAEVRPDFSIEIIPPKEGVVRGKVVSIGATVLVSGMPNSQNDAVRWSIQNVGYREANGQVVNLGRPARAFIVDGVLTVSLYEEGDGYDSNSNEGYLMVEVTSWAYPDIIERCKVTIKGAAPRIPEPKIRFMHAGNRSSLAIDWEGFLVSWGYGGSGILGNGKTSNSENPVSVDASTKFAFVTSGGAGDEPDMPLPYALAIAEDGTLWAWGSNEKGKTGLTTDSSFESRPMQVGQSNQWVHVSAGNTHSLGIQKDGTLWAWGESLYTGLSTAASAVTEPQQVGTSTNWMLAEAGEKHSVAVQKNGTLWVWGSNNESQLGISNEAALVQFPALLDAFDNTRISKAYTGREFSAVIDENGALWVWGAGSPDKKQRALPEKVSTPGVVLRSASVHSTGDHLFAIDIQGNPYAFGNSDELLGEPAVDTFVLLSELRSVAGSISAGSLGRRHALFLTDEYRIFGAGDSLYGEK